MELLTDECRRLRDGYNSLHDENSSLQLLVTNLEAQLRETEEIIAELQRALNKQPPPVAPRRRQ